MFCCRVAPCEGTCRDGKEFGMHLQIRKSIKCIVVLVLMRKLSAHRDSPLGLKGCLNSVFERNRTCELGIHSVVFLTCLFYFFIFLTKTRREDRCNCFFVV